MNKIQIRAEVFSSINNILSTQGKKEVVIKEAVEKLKIIEDKDFLSRLFIKEFISTNDSERASLISILMLNCIPVDDLERNLWSNLALKEVSDEKKYQLIEILKSMGKFIEYDKYLDYFEEPDKIIDLDTHKILSSAMLNPEAQIDFLDFMETLSKSDKLLLIQSMVEDYSSDDLANIISPIILYEKDNEIIETVISELINSKSPLAYYPMKRFIELTKDESLLRTANKGLKELQIMGITQEKAKSYYQKRFNNSLLYTCYASLPDGKGNQGLIFSRIRSDNSIQLFCTVINDKNGIVDCFGFNTISQLEFSLILKKFCNSDEAFVTTFETGLSWLEESEKMSFKNGNTLPYEYICWKEILFDVNKTWDNSSDIMIKALDILPKKECNFDEIFSTNYLDKLFFTKKDNNAFSNFIDSLDNEISLNGINLTKIEDKIKTNTVLIFDENTVDLIKTRLQKIAFILMSNSRHAIASQIYELSKNEKLLNEFYIEIIKKSIFIFYEEEFQQRFSSDIQKDNIFLKNSQKPNSKLDNTMLKDILEHILSEWGQDA